MSAEIHPFLLRKRKPLNANSANKAIIGYVDYVPLQVIYKGLKTSDNKKVTGANRLFLCWKKESDGRFKFQEILIGDERGILRIVPSFTHLLKKMNTPFKIWGTNISRNYSFFRFKLNKEYYILPFAADLFLSEGLGNPAFLKDPKQKFDVLCKRDSLPEPCWEDSNWDLDEKAFVYGTFFKVNPYLARKGLEIEIPFMEWLGLIHEQMYLANVERKICDMAGNHHAETYALLHFMKNTLAVMQKYPDAPDGSEPVNYRDNANYIIHALNLTEDMAKKIQEEYIEGDLKRRFIRWHKKIEYYCNNMITIIQHPEFLRSCMEVKQEEPWHEWLKPNAFADLITEAVTLISFHPDEETKQDFYRTDVLPLELRIAYELNDEQLRIIKEMLSPAVLKAMLPHRTMAEIEVYYNEVLNNCHEEIYRNEFGDFVMTFGVDYNRTNVDSGGLALFNLVAGPIGSLWNNQWGPPSYIGHIIDCFTPQAERMVTGGMSAKLRATMLIHRIRTSVAINNCPLKGLSGPVKTRLQKTRTIVSKKLKTIAPYSFDKLKASLARRGKYGKYIGESLFDKKGWRIQRDPLGRLSSQAPAGINILCSAVSLYVAVRDTATTMADVKKRGELTWEHMGELFRSFSSGGFAITGLLPTELLNRPLFKTLNTTVVGYGIVPITFALELCRHADNCKTELSQGRYDLVVLNGFQTALKAYGLYNVVKMAVCRLLLTTGVGKSIARTIFKNAARKVLMSQVKGAATKKSGVIIVDMFLTALFLAQDVSEMMRKMKIKPLGLIAEFSGMIDEKFKSDTPLETELKKITIPKYPKTFKVPLRYAEKTHVDESDDNKVVTTQTEYGWNDIYDFLNGKAVRGLNYIRFWNIDAGKAKAELLSAGLPIAYVAYLCKMNRDEFERKEEVNIQEEVDIIQEASDIKFDANYRKTEAKKFIKRKFNL